MKVVIREPADCPYYLISRASLAATAYLKRELAAAGFERVRPAYLGVLQSLWLDDGLKAVELGRRAGLEPSTMTGLLDRMEQDELVTRQPDPEDRRAQRIHLTPEGRRAREPVMGMMATALERMLEGVKERELDNLRATLRQVLANADRRA